jgi:hypothetical protein
MRVAARPMQAEGIVSGAVPVRQKPIERLAEPSRQSWRQRLAGPAAAGDFPECVNCRDH